MKSKDTGGVELVKGFPTVVVNGHRYALAGSNYRQFDALPHIWVSDTGDVWDDKRKMVLAQLLDKDGRWRVMIRFGLRKYAVLVQKLRLKVHGV